MSFEEDDLLPISALQHLLFCERQCALIHLECLWAENRLTIEGNQLHEKAHSGPAESRAGTRITRGLPLQSFQLGLVGQADVIEWEPPQSQNSKSKNLARVLLKASLQQRREWRITPIEYKRGKPKTNDCDRVQLCAQAMCLEEMLDVSIQTGELFYGEHRRRVSVSFDSSLREIVRQAAARLHEIMSSGITPPAIREKKCDSCSLVEICIPDAAKAGSARKYIQRMTDVNES